MILILCIYNTGSLGNYQIEKEIGKGQFSVVYRACCKVDNRIVALKKVQIFEMNDSKARLDCMKEINLLQVNNKLIMCFYIYVPEVFFNNNNLSSSTMLTRCSHISVIH